MSLGAANEFDANVALAATAELITKWRRFIKEKLRIGLDRFLTVPNIAKVRASVLPSLLEEQGLNR